MVSLILWYAAYVVQNWSLLIRKLQIYALAFNTPTLYILKGKGIVPGVSRQKPSKTELNYWLWVNQANQLHEAGEPVIRKATAYSGRVGQKQFKGDVK